MKLAKYVVRTFIILCPLGVVDVLAEDDSVDLAEAKATKYVGFEEVVVTARKREERLQDIPVAITAFSAQDLERYATDSFDQIAAQTPELVTGAASSPGGAVINLRGVGSSTTTPSVDQAVSLNVDGIQFSSANGLQLGLYDLQRVEILKGPQALFYGKNSPGGVISLVSADPSAEKEWRIRTGYEVKHEQKFIEGMVSLPINENTGLRLVGYTSDQDGWFRNAAKDIPGGQGASVSSAPKQSEIFVRGTLKYEHPDDVFDATLKVANGTLDRDNGLLAGDQYFACALGAPQASLGLPGAINDCKVDRYSVESDYSAATTALDPAFLDGKPYYESDQFLTTLALNFAITDDLTLTSVTGYYDLQEKWTTNFSGGELERLITGADTTVEQFTQEIRITSDYDSPVNFMVGGFYQDAELGLDIPTAFAGPLAAGFFGPGTPPILISKEAFTQETSAYSVFGQLLWDFAENWELTVGARYSHEEKEATGVRLPSAFSGFTTLPIPFLEPKISFTNTSPEMTLSYRPTGDLTLYAAYREGFTSGGYNLVPISLGNGAPNDNAYDQSTVEGVELGARGTVVDGQIKYNVTLYKYEYEDLQLSASDLTGGLALTIRNAGASTIQGIEFSIDAAPEKIPGLTLRSDVAYNDAEFDSYTNAGCYGGQTFQLGCNGNVVGGVGGSQDLSGQRLERAPEWSLNVGGTYEHLLPNGMMITTSLDANYTDEYISQPEHDPRSIVEDAWRINASIVLNGDDDAWSLALIGNNLTNELRVVKSFGMPFTGFGEGTTTGASLFSDLAGSVSDPRTILLQLTLRNNFFE